jgi:hypothetical protein
VFVCVLVCVCVCVGVCVGECVCRVWAILPFSFFYLICAPFIAPSGVPQYCDFISGPSSSNPFIKPRPAVLSVLFSNYTYPITYCIILPHSLYLFRSFHCFATLPNSTEPSYCVKMILCILYNFFPDP